MLLAKSQPLGSLGKGVEKVSRQGSLSPRVFSLGHRSSSEEMSPRNRMKMSASSVGQATETRTSEAAGQVPVQSIALDSSKQLVLRFGTHNIPHPEKSDYGGEDAYFTSAVGGGAFGIADGVGGWQDSGINPAEYSRTFMRLACAYLEGKTVQPVTASELMAASGGNARGRAVTPSDASLRNTSPSPSAGLPESMKTLTPKGALAVAHRDTSLPGSTTACVLRLDRSTGKLSAANLGDSGFLIVRDGKVLFKSPALQHFFDCPLQFAAYPDFTSASDEASDAGIYEIAVRPGDFIVAGTDGLWDNVPNEEIITQLPGSSGRLAQAAHDLATMASRHAHDKKYPSPYSQEAVRQGVDIPFFLRLMTASFSDGKFRLGHMKGGKVDDITVIIASVDEEDAPVAEPQATRGEASNQEEATAQEEAAAAFG